MAAYRIIQEALTNVLRHSQARGAAIHIHQTPRQLIIGIGDPGPARAQPGDSGSGLAGIRERVGALGGMADIGPDPEGGFTVHVAIPLADKR